MIYAPQGTRSHLARSPPPEHVTEALGAYPWGVVYRADLYLLLTWGAPPESALEGLHDLVSVVQVLLQSERLKIARALPEAQTLTSELLAFKVSISLTGHDSYGNDVGPWRENPHDDLVLAVALACWYGEKYRPPDPEYPSFSFSSARY